MSQAPERIHNWQDSQLSIARFYGGINFTGCEAVRVQKKVRQMTNKTDKTEKSTARKVLDFAQQKHKRLVLAASGRIEREQKREIREARTTVERNARRSF